LSPCSDKRPRPISGHSECQAYSQLHRTDIRYSPSISVSVQWFGSGQNATKLNGMI